MNWWPLCIIYYFYQMSSFTTLLRIHPYTLSSFALTHITFWGSYQLFYEPFIQMCSDVIRTISMHFSCSYWVPVSNFQLLSNFDPGNCQGVSLALYYYVAFSLAEFNLMSNIIYLKREVNKIGQRQSSWRSCSQKNKLLHPVYAHMHTWGCQDVLHYEMFKTSN